MELFSFWLLVAIIRQTVRTGGITQEEIAGGISQSGPLRRKRWRTHFRCSSVPSSATITHPDFSSVGPDFNCPFRVLRSSLATRIMVAMTEFTHLHLHTEYSLLDGACDVHKLVSRVAKLGQTSVAMTDHGNIYGAVHFFAAAKARHQERMMQVEKFIRKGVEL